MKVRARRTPTIQPDPTSLRTLISWESDIHEPIFTCHLNKSEIMNLVDTPLTIPPYSIHTQSVERAVQLVTQAA